VLDVKVGTENTEASKNTALRLFSF
jgi:hypothetical protein